VSVPPTASTPTTGELQGGRPVGGAPWPTGWPARSPTAARCIQRFEGTPGWRMSPRSLAHRACIHALSGCQLTATLPLHLLDRDAARKIANPRPPGSRGCCSGDIWRFARQVGNVGAACAAAGAVHLARIAPSPEPEARHRKHLIGPPGPPANHLAPNREPAQMYSTWKRGTPSSAPC
jgi:hypothetical protein